MLTMFSLFLKTMKFPEPSLTSSETGEPPMTAMQEEKVDHQDSISSLKFWGVLEVHDFFC